MFTICRLILIATVLATAAFLAALSAKFGNVVVLLVAVAAGVQVLRGRRRAKLDGFGTARWAGERDVRQAGLTAGHGLILGTLCDSGRPSQATSTLNLFNPLVPSAQASNDFLRAIFPRLRGNLPLVRLSRAVHTAVFAPTGVGKGVSCAIPFLLDCPESCVVVDFKGELAKATMAARRRMGQRVVLLDPYEMVGSRPDTLNPIDFLRKDSPHVIDEIRDLAESLVIRTGQEREPHFLDSAEAWLAAGIAAVVEFGDEDDRSLQTVRELLSDPKKIEIVIKLLSKSEAWEGMLSRFGYQLMHYKDKELGSTLTTVNRFLRNLDTLAVAASTRASSFDPNRLTQEKTTVYLVLPPEHARAQSPLLRMWISTLLRGVLRGGLQEQNRVHFVLDEAASLSHLESLDDAVDKYRGYGVRLIFMYQSLGQLKKCFPEGQDQTLLSNVTQVFFGVNDPPTAEYVSNRLGDETIVVESGGSSWGGSRQYSHNSQGDNSSRSWNTTSNWQQQGRKLLKPEEVTSLSPRIAITFAAPGLPPICTRLTRYYEGRPNSWGRKLMQGVRANVYAAAALAAVICGTTLVREIDSQPKLPRPRVVPGVPDRRLPQKKQGEKNAIWRENQARA
ncbi:MAG: type IV secretory system conjugative DNA transfer family protein [Thermoguttaceae bacterium]